jgi:hypothetical protein
MHSSALVLRLGKFFDVRGAQRYLQAAQQSVAEFRADVARDLLVAAQRPKRDTRRTLDLLLDIEAPNLIAPMDPLRIEAPVLLFMLGNLSVRSIDEEAPIDRLYRSYGAHMNDMRVSDSLAVYLTHARPRHIQVVLVHGRDMRLTHDWRAYIAQRPHSCLVEPTGLQLKLAFRTEHDPRLPHLSAVRVEAKAQQQDMPLAVSLSAMDLADVLGILDRILVSDVTVDAERSSHSNTNSSSSNSNSNSNISISNSSSDSFGNSNDTNVGASSLLGLQQDIERYIRKERTSFELTIEIPSAHLKIFADSTVSDARLDVVRLELMQSKFDIAVHDHDKTVEWAVRDVCIVDCMAPCDDYRWLLERITESQRESLRLCYKVRPMVVYGC